ncbi:MAG: glycosyl transferase, partial [Bacteroides sp. SM23_62]
MFGLTILAHLAGLTNDVFLSDSALFASIAKEMALSNNFLDLTFDGIDWLDKPHFPFWITAISFKIFGINTFAFKFPAILFTLLALFYTYRFTSELYNRETAMLAVLILATAQHLIISNNDVRAEPFLTGLVIASIYHYHRLVQRYHWTNLVCASLFAGLSVMTKGLFTLIPIGGAVAGEIIIKRQFRLIQSSRWILSLIMVFLFITPELYALYHQFDSHPEKIVFGRTGVSGIGFFLWDSQFGRFFNTGPIKGSGNPFFFFHTLLWAFLPWSIVMYYAFFKKIIRNIRSVNQQAEFYTISGSLLALLVFSLSGFQLPHYTNIIFPLLAIMTADWIHRAEMQGELRFYMVAQSVTI